MAKDTNLDMLFFSMREHDDKDAFRSIFTAFFAPLCVFANRYTSDADMSKDVVEDVFVYLWENRKNIVLTCSVRTYLSVCTKNRCLNILKHDTVHQKYVDHVKAHSGMTTDSDSLLTYEELQEKLQCILESLPDAYRIAFVMSQLHEEKTSVIAERLQVSERTVERLKLRAREIVRREMGKYYPLLLVCLSLYTFESW
jgi:RNA polymerase sigma-70 factor (family 1)